MKNLLIIFILIIISCSPDNPAPNNPSAGNCIELDRFTFCKEHDNNQVLAKQNYLNKRIQLYGKIEDLYDKNDTLIIELNLLTTGAPTWGTFFFIHYINDRERVKFLKYKKEDNIRLCGIYSQLKYLSGTYLFYFKDSEIIE